MNSSTRVPVDIKVTQVRLGVWGHKEIREHKVLWDLRGLQALKVHREHLGFRGLMADLVLLEFSENLASRDHLAHLVHM